MSVIPRTIRLLAPSGYPHDAMAVERALERLHAEHHRLENVEATQRRYQRFAGTDRQRAGDLNHLAELSWPLPEIGLAVRGGYGAIRLLHELDYRGLESRFRDQPMVLVGHSDFTALQLALLARAQAVTFGGPMLMTHFGAKTLSAYTMEHFWRTVSQPEMTLAVEIPQVQDVNVSGVLWGGNLSIVAALVATPYMPQIEGGILFLEDVNEQPFRIERMIYQLYLSGILARQQVLVLGQFTGTRMFESDNGYDIHSVIEQVRNEIGIPVVTGLPFGHIADMVTLPVGAPARLIANERGFTLTVSDYPHFA